MPTVGEATAVVAAAARGMQTLVSSPFVGNGVITFDEFCNLMSTQEDRRKYERQQLLQQFKACRRSPQQAVDFVRAIVQKFSLDYKLALLYFI